MNVNTLIRDLDFYLRAIGRGGELLLVIGVLTVCSFVRNEPLL
ncbi:MAG TPA: hypothetical protein VMT44_02925 [Methanoregula sp.]|nr:hypothetical protein [Methanoregula sp.]